MADSLPQRPQAGATAPDARAPTRPTDAAQAALAALDAIHALDTLGADDAWPAVVAEAGPAATAPSEFGDLVLVPADPVPTDEDGLGAWLGALDESDAPQPPADDGAQSGELTPASLPLLLAELRAHRRTGLLLIQAGSAQCRLAFVEGELTSASGSRAEHELASVLLASGRVAARALDGANAEAVRQGRALGAVLVERGELGAAALREARIELARRVLFDLLACDDGDYLFGPRERSADDDERLPTGELLLDLVRSFDDPDVVRFALGDLGATLSIAPEAYAAGGPRLDSVDRAVLAAVDGRASAREVLARTPGDPDEARRSLLALLTAALVRRH